MFASRWDRCGCGGLRACGWQVRLPVLRYARSTGLLDHVSSAKRMLSSSYNVCGAVEKISLGAAATPPSSFFSLRRMSSAAVPPPHTVADHTTAAPPPSSSMTSPPRRVLPSYKSSHATAAKSSSPKAGRVSVADLAAGLRRSSCSDDTGPVPPRDLTPLQKRQLLMKNKATFVLTPQAVRRVRYLIEQYQIKQSDSETQGQSGATENAAQEKKAGGTNALDHSMNAAVPDGIRIGVRRRGCSGYSYTVNYHFPATSTSSFNANSTTAAPASIAKSEKKVWSPLDEDTVVEQEGLKVVVAADALFYVIGTVMDYVVLNVEEKFVFRNPNKKYSCGCEESFMPFDSEDMDD